MKGFDLADAERGVLASAHAGGAAVVFDHGEVLGAGPASLLGAATDGDDRRRSLALGEVTLEVELKALGEPVRLSGELVGSEELAICQAIGSLRRPKEETEIACLAVTTETVADSDPDAALRRSIAIALADGGLIALAAARPPPAAGHGEEEMVAVVAGPEWPQAIDEVLLSTEYDGEGHHRRATLELWREGEPPLRGAGTIVCGATVSAEELTVETAFFRWSVNGRPGLGRYEIVSRR